MSEFERRNVLGSGTYGKVYEIKINKTNKIAALKEMYYDEYPISGFGNLREIEILNKMSESCHFIPDILFLHRTPYEYKSRELEHNEQRTEFLSFVCESALCSGEEFFGKNRYTYDISTALKLSAELLMAISHIHRYNIFHRDIKPGNVLIYIKNGVPTLKLCDFGFAIHKSSTAPCTPKINTYYYRAPEVVMCVCNYKMNTDIWSAGCTIYEIFTNDILMKKAEKFMKNANQHILFFEECLRLIPNEWTVEAQNMYRRYSSYDEVKVFGKSETVKTTTTYRNFNKLFQKSPKYSTEDGQREIWNKVDLLLKDCLDFSYWKRKEASAILEEPYFDSLREYINEETSFQEKEIVFENIVIKIPEDKQREKVEYFTEAWEILRNGESKISSRIFFHAVDLANLVLTSYPGIKHNINNICAACMYLFSKHFNVLHFADDVRIFFFKSYSTESLETEETYKTIDKFIHDFEKTITNKNKFGLNLYKDTIYEMQDQYDHFLDKSQLSQLFMKFITVNDWLTGQSYRYMYRLLYNELFDEIFQI